MAEARRVLDRALWAAARAGVTAESEILEGAPGKRILEFARDCGARLVVVGRRRRRFGRSVSSAVIRTAGRPVVVAQGSDRGGGDVRQPSGRGPISHCDRPRQPHR
jgi:nucleotide-binding universal stress UspA family protein